MKNRILFLVSCCLLSLQALAQYCVPVVGTISSCGVLPLTMRINSVSTNNAVTNINNPNNGCSGYTYYTGAGNTVVANAGSNVNIIVNTQAVNPPLPLTPASYPYRVVIWVDWNRDGVFDNTTYNPITMTGERMAESSPPPTYVNGNFTTSLFVPLNAKNGITRMRVRAGTRNGQLPSAPPANSDPCVALSHQHGEVEDYDFDVVNPCLPPDKINFTNLTDKSATIKWRKKHNAVEYEYWVSTTKSVPDPGLGNYFTTDTFVNLPDANIPLECGKKYYVYVRSICDNTKQPQALWEQSSYGLDSFTVPECCYIPEVTITNISSTTAIASWSPVSTVQQYEYAVRTDAVIPQTGTITTSTSVLLQGLAPGKELYFFLRAHCSPTPLSGWGLDSFLTQLTSGIGSVSNNSDFSIMAFPNPAKDKITIALTQGSRAGIGMIEVADITGKILALSKMESDMQDIDLTGKPAGIYLIRYRDEKNNDVIKINKE